MACGALDSEEFKCVSNSFIVGTLGTLLKLGVQQALYRWAGRAKVGWVISFKAGQMIRINSLLFEQEGGEALWEVGRWVDGQAGDLVGGGCPASGSRKSYKEVGLALWALGSSFSCEPALSNSMF